VPLCPEVPGLRERETGAASSSGQNGLSPRNHQAVADDHCRPVWSSSPEHERSRIRFSNYGLLQQVSHIRASPLPNPRKIIGRSRDFQDFLTNYGVTPYYNSLYTPQNNPTERVNRTMKSLIISYIEQDQRKWDNNLDRVACALRTARHEDTKQTNKTVKDGTLKENLG
jgi:hypothetical protein